MKIDDTFDEIEKTLFGPDKPGDEGPPPAAAVNTLGEVPDSAWYTNRHGRKRMSIDELLRGPGNDRAPQGEKWTIVSAKDEGVTPGFVIRDAAGRGYLLKFDTPSAPNATTAADVIGSKIYYALGYNTPENYIVDFSREQLTIGDKATVTDINGARRKMTSYDLDKLLQLAPRHADGRYRAMASLWIEGEVLGPWQYSDTRPDDPNDIYPHQNRRDLRGLYVFGAWLNHYDATALNTLDTIVEEHGLRFVRHYLIDFGSMLGSSARGARNPRNGYVYHYDLDFAWKEALSFGLFIPKWQRTSYAHLPEAGRFEGDAFDPLNWKPIYPNPAFINRRPDDIYWAAKKVAAFSDEEIRKLIEAGQYNDDRTVDYLTSVLIQRRDKIARTAFSMVLPLDNFAVMNGEVVFDDLAVKSEFRDALDLSEDWFTYNPTAGNGRHLAHHGLRLPPEAATAKTGSVIGLTLRARQQPSQSVDVFMRRTSDGGWDVVGIRRTW